MIYLEPGKEPTQQRYQIGELSLSDGDLARFAIEYFLLTHLFKFGKTCDWVSKSQIAKGVTTKDGKVVTRGTGLSIRSIDNKTSQYYLWGEDRFIMALFGKPGRQQCHFFLNIPTEVIALHAIEAGYFSVDEWKTKKRRLLLEKFGIPEEGFDAELWFIANQVRYGYITLNQIRELLEHIQAGRLGVVLPDMEVGAVYTKPQVCHRWLETPQTAQTNHAEALQQKRNDLMQYLDMLKNTRPPESLRPTGNKTNPTSENYAPVPPQTVRPSSANRADTVPCPNNNINHVHVHAGRPAKNTVATLDYMTIRWRQKFKTPFPWMLVLKHFQLRSQTEWFKLLDTAATVEDFIRHASIGEIPLASGL